MEAIKNIELMDIRDCKESEVIHNIMAKRTSGIERESRQLAAEQVGLRTAEKDKNVGVANEQAAQHVQTQQRETAVKEMDRATRNTCWASGISKPRRPWARPRRARSRPPTPR